MTRVSFLILIWLAIAGAPVAALTIDVQAQADDRAIDVNLSGAIVAGDQDHFRRAILPFLSRGYLLSEVRLSSGGGLVDEAIGIGEQIALLRAATRAPSAKLVGADCRLSDKSTFAAADGSCLCASACFLIWLGGLKRLGDSVAIHAPFLRGEEPNTRGRTLGFQEQDAVPIRRYLTMRGVPDAVVRRMFDTPSFSLYFLSAEDIRLLRNRRYEDFVAGFCSLGSAGGQSCERNAWDRLREDGRGRYIANQRY